MKTDMYSFKYECNQSFKVEANREMYSINSVAIAKTDDAEVFRNISINSNYS